MKAITETSIFDWIVNDRTSLPAAYKAIPLSCVLPVKFDRYAKILHRLDGFYDNVDRPLGTEEIEVLNIPDCTAVRSLVTEKRGGGNGARIWWKEVANALGLPYAQEITHAWFSKVLGPNPECWPRFIYGPADGALQIDESVELASLLGRISSDQQCFFRLPEMPFIGMDRDLLFRGKLADVPDFFASFQFGPEYWWPSDHQWCVCSDYDLTFSIVGGSSELISSLLRSDVLECLEVDPTIRVDSLVPLPQAPVSDERV